MRKLKEYYTSVAVTLLSTVLLLIFVNAVFSGLSATRHAFLPDPGPVWKYGWPRVSAAYPGWAKSDIVEVLNDVYFDGAIEYEPFTEFRERPRQKKYVSVDPAGFRVVKNQGAWPPDPSFVTIFVFGGSTTFGYGVTNEETIPSFLQEKASADPHRKPIRVYNFGRGYYFSSQETVLLYHLLVSGVVPDVAVFIDGLNDFVYPDGNPEYTKSLKNFMDGRQIPAFIVRSPIMRTARFINERLLQTSERQPPASDDKEEVKAVVDRWLRNKRLTESIAKSFGVHAVFVWQPAPTYKYDLRYHPFSGSAFAEFGAHQRSRSGYALLDQLRKGTELGDDFLWLGDIQERRAESLYVDLLHYKPAFAKEMAVDIYEFMQTKGWLSGDVHSD